MGRDHLGRVNASAQSIRSDNAQVRRAPLAEAMNATAVDPDRLMFMVHVRGPPLVSFRQARKYVSV